MYRCILKLVETRSLNWFSFVFNSDEYLTVPVSIPKVPKVLPIFKKSFNWPIKNIPFVPRYTAIILLVINFTNKLIVVLAAEYVDVLIKFICN